MLRPAFSLGLTLAALAAGWSASTAGPFDGPAPLRMTVRSHLAGPICDRREVGECQDTARARAIMCDAFADRLGCADAVLRAQSACFRATGCY